MIKKIWNPRTATIKQRTTNKPLQDYGIKNPVKEMYNIMEGQIKMGKKIKAMEVLKDGAYTGIIEMVEFKLVQEKFEYTDIFIKEDKTNIVIRAGVPTNISEMTALGHLLERFGQKIVAKKDYDVEEILTGKKISFVVVIETTKKGTFSNVQIGSIKPIK